MKLPIPTDQEVEILDKTSELFHQEVENDGLLDQFAREGISEAELASRAVRLLQVSKQRAEALILGPAPVEDEEGNKFVYEPDEPGDEHEENPGVGA
jgi:hypothetical protein